MAVERSFMLKLFADPKEVLNAFGKIRQAADEMFSGAGKEGLDKLGANLTKFGLMGSAASAAVGGALFAMAKQADSANREVLKLSTAIANQDRLASGAEQRFLDLAKSIQQKTAADADAIVGAQALLVNFGMTEKQIRTLTPLIVDLARQSGVSLSDAAMSVAKSVDGSAKALKGFGIEVDEVAIKNNGFQATMDALSKTVGGFAEKEGATFSGSLERMRNNFGDLAEGIGGGAAQVFTPLADLAGKATNAIASLDKVSNGAVGSIAAVGTLAVGAASQISLYAGQAIKLRDAFSSVTEIGGETSRTITTLGKSILAAGGIIAGAVIVYSLYSAKKQEAKQRTEDLSEALKLEGAAQNDSIQALVMRDYALRKNVETAKKLGISIQDIASFVDGKEVPSIQRLVAMRDKLSQSLQMGTLQQEQAIGKNGELVEVTKGEIAQIIGLVDQINLLVSARQDEAAAAALVAGATDEVIKKKIQERSLEQIIAEVRVRSTLAKYDDIRAYDATNKTLKDFQREQGFATTAVKSGSKATKDAKEKMKEYEQSVNSAKNASDAFKRSQRSVEDRTESLAEANQNLKKAQDALAAAQKAGDSLKIASAQRALAAAERTVTRAKFSQEESVIAVRDAELRLAEIRKDPESTPDEIRKAEIALEEAKLAVADADDRAVESGLNLLDVRRDLRIASEGLRDGDKELIPFQDAVTEAQKRQKHATRDLNDAIEEQKDALTKYKKALEELADVIKKFPRIAATNPAEGLIPIPTPSRSGGGYGEYQKTVADKVEITVNSSVVNSAQVGQEIAQYLESYTRIAGPLGNYVAV